MHICFPPAMGRGQLDVSRAAPWRQPGPGSFPAGAVGFQPLLSDLGVSRAPVQSGAGWDQDRGWELQSLSCKDLY